MRGIVNWLLLAGFYSTSVAIGAVLWGSDNGVLWSLPLGTLLVALWWAIDHRMRCGTSVDAA